MAISWNTTPENILDCFSALGSCLYETLTPYEEFSLNGGIYYFTPGGFLYCKDARAERAGGFCCGYLTDEVWHYKTDDG
jgi:hypothetical protein